MTPPATSPAAVPPLPAHLAPESASTARCGVHGRHVPRTHVQERHHIWPKGLGGPTVAGNLVWVCATGHNSLHKLMALLAAHAGDVARDVLAAYHPEEIRLARLGYQRSVQKHL